ncbi:MAG: 30S ribosomal protein S9 [Candidatus Lambdaproteobacteria bacterium RIFOXYD1_FULL_56_27]|uniref:Small ribosomal subunit protein uS9 n=1 Tax=Candidatus Lambdaproteobacteria bacterium RIFOXYD2_FULL_56_26 TaxID=1817773 RepID=A0A1F6H2U5_9PROT|nr:MAG: 30S ribosomal protein S9 [Candidatus Lambdaproteobacteria bacterium RIFOXYC1_FULL_56_13]OGH04600.1 MAG: 30S ribosomal protein S9 [Candidatus Lambdaproteobacteria bacterium RIFOXYD2_FULL_56_26]OGH09064.1 MAG: 30S ribosomal protein S9 [Candidatus Lambdaproteobacteria bacterium RIFOXYD1_FULL_56_27]
MSQHYGTGRRKTSVARVFLRPGTGKFIVNQREASEFFTRDLYLIQINAPLAAAEKQGKFDVFATVKGGGTTGQAGAITHGVARALVHYSEDLRSSLRKGGFLTRDAREVERQKYGQKGARARYQFSKR